MSQVAPQLAVLGYGRNREYEADGSACATSRGKVVRVVAVKDGDTVESLSARMAYPDYRRERFSTLNGIAADATLAPGTLVKLVVNTPRHPSESRGLFRQG